LCEPVPRAGGPGPDPSRDRGGERQFRPRRNHQEVHPDRTPTHARGRGADANDEVETELCEQAVRERDRRHVRRTGGRVNPRERFDGEGPEGPAFAQCGPKQSPGKRRRPVMSKSIKALGLAIGALALTQLPAAAQTKVTNDGISATEIVIGTHQDLSGPIKMWGVPVSNGMKMAVEEINAAGGIQGRKLRMILEDNGYDPKRAVLASQKMVERDKIFAMIGPMGSPTVLAAQDVLFDAGVL